MPIHHYSMDEPYPIRLLLAGMGLTGTFMWLTGRAMYPELAAWWGGAELGSFKGFMLSFLGFWFLLAFGGFQAMALELVKPFCGRWGTHPLSLFSGIVFICYATLLPLGWGLRELYRSYRVETEGVTLAAQARYENKDYMATCTLPGQAEPLRTELCPLWWDDAMRLRMVCGRPQAVEIAYLPEEPDWRYCRGVGLRIRWWLPGLASTAVGLFWLLVFYQHTIPWFAAVCRQRRRPFKRI